MAEKILSYLKFHGIDIVMAITIAIIGLIIAFVIKKIVNNSINKRAHDKTAKLFLANLFHTLLLIIILIMVLNKFGVPTTSLIAVLGASSLAIALALKDSLSNVASGIILVFCQPFKIGDSIETSSTLGSVVKISLYNTTLKTANNDMVFIPNSKIFNDKIINHSAEQTKRMIISFYINSNCTVNDVERIILEAISQDSRVIQEPKPSLSIAQVDSIGILLNTFVWSSLKDHGALKKDLLKIIIAQLQENNIKIPTVSTNT